MAGEFGKAISTALGFVGAGGLRVAALDKGVVGEVAKAIAESDAEDWDALAEKDRRQYARRAKAAIECLAGAAQQGITAAVGSLARSPRRRGS